LSALAATAVLAMLGGLRRLSLRDLPALLSLGLLQLAAFFALAHAAVAWVPAGRTAILSNATLIWAVPLSLLVLRERIPARRWVAAGLGAAGILVLTGPWSLDWSVPNLLLGHLLLLGAAGCWATTMVIVRRWPPCLTMLELLPWSFSLASAALLPNALLHGIGTWPGPAVLSLLGIGLVAAPIGTWCVMQATVSLPLVVASIGFLAAPAVGLLMSAAWLGEALSLDVLLGAGLVLGGAAVAALPERRAVRA
jgi:drug/metabolite transporter (DMT)-like permease